MLCESFYPVRFAFRKQPRGTQHTIIGLYGEAGDARIAQIVSGRVEAGVVTVPPFDRTRTPVEQ